MGLSSKRQKEVTRAKRSAQDVLDEQRAALDRATELLRDARRRAGLYAREDFAPRVRDAYDDRVRPTLATGIAAGREVGSIARDGFVSDVMPAVSNAVGSALAVIDAAPDPRGRDAVRAADRARRSIVPDKRGAGPARYILLGFAVVVAASVAYAAWQTLRADEDLWIEDLAEDLGEAELDDDQV